MTKGDNWEELMVILGIALGGVGSSAKNQPLLRDWVQLQVLDQELKVSQGSFDEMTVL